MTALPQLESSISAAVGSLLETQRPDGSWQDFLPSAAISTATSVVALHYSDPDSSAVLVTRGLRWLRENQLPCGGWGDAPCARPSLPATAFAVAALALLAPSESKPEIASAVSWIESVGGMEAVADPDRCALHVLCLQFLALAGLYDERRIRRMPAGVALLPRKLRQKVSFVVPVTLAWTVMQSHTRQFSWPMRMLFRAAEGPASTYFDELTEYEPPDGGSQESPLLVSLIGFAFARAGERRDLVERSVRYLHRTVRPDGSWPVNRDLELSATTFVTMGLQDAGARDDDRLTSTNRWIRSNQWNTPFSPTGCPSGGWAWSSESGWPNSDDTADALMSLAGFGHDASDPQIADGISWLLQMQNRNGSWSCFCKDNHVALDAPCAVITAHAVDALIRAGGLDADHVAIRRAVSWFGRTQNDDGSIGCLWYRGKTAGTAQVLEVLGELGLADARTARRCIEWLSANQNPDGGWGDGEGAESSAEETAWALSGLLRAGVPADDQRPAEAATWLIERQRPDGMWTPTVLGVYFLDLWYCDDLLATGYTLQALARFRRAKEAA
ncbi:MAG: prenyltransferase/squalene oxidase repeat-containing protein [Jatrophihabitans sp.]